MNFFFCVFTGVLLAVIQTALAAVFLDAFFDLMLPFIVYLILFRPTLESLSAVIGLGFLMDSLSAGPAGLMGLTYFSLYLIMMWTGKYLDTETFIVFPLIISLAALWEALWIVCVKLVFVSGFDVSAETFILMMKQMIWAAAVGPLALFAVKAGQTKLNDWRGNLLAEVGENGGSV